MPKTGENPQNKPSGLGEIPKQHILINNETEIYNPELPLYLEYEDGEGQTYLREVKVVVAAKDQSNPHKSSHFFTDKKGIIIFVNVPAYSLQIVRVEDGRQILDKMIDFNDYQAGGPKLIAIPVEDLKSIEELK